MIGVPTCTPAQICLLITGFSFLISGGLWAQEIIAPRIQICLAQAFLRWLTRCRTEGVQHICLAVSRDEEYRLFWCSLWNGATGIGR